MKSANPKRDDYYLGLRESFGRRHKSLDPLASTALYEIIQTFGSAETRLSRLIQPHNLTLSGLNVLCILHHAKDGGLPLNEISQLLLVSRANITGVIDGLAEKGFVKREDHATDRRVILAKITERGSKWLDEYLPQHYTEMATLFKGLKPAETKTLIQLLQRLRQSSCRHPGETTELSR